MRLRPCCRLSLLTQREDLARTPSAPPRAPGAAKATRSAAAGASAGAELATGVDSAAAVAEVARAWSSAEPCTRAASPPAAPRSAAPGPRARGLVPATALAKVMVAPRSCVLFELCPNHRAVPRARIDEPGEAGDEKGDEAARLFVRARM